MHLLLDLIVGSTRECLRRKRGKYGLINGAVYIPVIFFLSYFHQIRIFQMVFRDSTADIDDGAALYNRESALIRLLLCVLQLRAKRLLDSRHESGTVCRKKMCR